jgi:hypothetical protein
MKYMDLYCHFLMVTSYHLQIAGRTEIVRQS